MPFVPFNLESFGHTDIGLVRTNNEDVFVEMPRHHFYALADGMGGHKAGEVAAQETVVYLCDCIDKLFKTSPKSFEINEIYDHLFSFIQHSNKRIFELGQETKAYQGMGTTLCSMLFYKDFLIYAHVGDSRIYRFRDQTLSLLTQDHTLKNKLIHQGNLTPTDAKASKYKNVLTRAIGTYKTISPEIGVCRVLPHDLFFMCSDGLSDFVTDEEISGMLDPSQKVQDMTIKLIERAKLKGGHDNITVLMTKTYL